MGVEVSIGGKLRSERAHFEKHSSGVVPKSGDVADRIVKSSISHVSTKMGLLGIQVKIAIKDEIPPEFELLESVMQKQESIPLPSIQDANLNTPAPATPITGKAEETVTTEVKTNGQG